MDFDFISKTFVRLLAALPLTLSVWFLSVVLGALIAAGVTWMRVSGVKPLEWFARAYVMVFRGTPLLIQLFVVYYGLASLPAVRASFAWGFLRDAFNCAVLALALCTAAYQAEIFRGALLACRTDRSRRRAPAACRGSSCFAGSSFRLRSGTRFRPIRPR